jgi:hypothetical protein
MSLLTAILNSEGDKMFEDLKTPVEIDTALANLYNEKFDLEMKIDSYRRSIEVYAEREYYASAKSKAEAKVRELVLEVGEVLKKKRVLEDKYTGWSRAFLVSNTNGHIHSSMDCATCFDTTRYVWLTDLSGQDRLEIAGLAGEKACSVCYPDAPSEYFARKCQLEDPAVVKAREERAEAKAVREAKRLAVGVFNPDGSAVKVRSSYGGRYLDELKTERTARIWAKDTGCWIANYHADKREGWKVEREETLANLEADFEMVLVALAFKAGVEVDVVRAEIQDKIDKQLAKNARERAKWIANNPQYADLA